MGRPRKGPDQETKSYIAALLEELRGAEVYDRDNVEAIRDELRRLGYHAEKPSKQAETRPAGYEVETR